MTIVALGVARRKAGDKLRSIAATIGIGAASTAPCRGFPRAAGPSMNDLYRQRFDLDPTLGFHSPLLADLHGYWLKKRGAGAMPRRRDIDPLDPELRPHLGFVVLTDVVAPERFRFRLVGSLLAEAVGRDSTGKYLDEVYSPADYERMILAYRWVVAHRAPLRVTGNLRHANRAWISMESVDLPLSSDGRGVDMILTRSVLGTA